VQLMFPEGTGPPVVGGLKLHDAVSTTVPGGCWTVTVALTKARSVMISVQLEFGHSGAPGIGFVGGEVVTLNATFPFLTSLAGMPTLPDTVTRAGFCPGAWFTFVPGLPHVAVGCAVAVIVTFTSPNPRPEIAPEVVKVRGLGVPVLSVNEGREWSPLK